MGWMEDELKRRRLGESLALFTRLSQAEPEDGLVRYFLGEVHRLRGGDEGERLALETYEKAAGLPGAPAEVHRALGRMHRKAGRADAMKQAFARYLELRPDAGDAEMIRSYLKEP
jgi:Flp pilus assembly protein TadD